MNSRFGTAALLVCCALTPHALAQVRKWHTRDVTRLSQVQVADYLRRSDIIFIPVGAVETNGIMPSDRDYVAPLGFAAALAEEVDAVYFPHLAYSYPGTTVTGSATVYVTPDAGIAYFKVIAKSLLRQGYRRQVWISSGQGPAALTVGTLVREFYEETHVPILYIDMDDKLPKIAADRKDKILWGEHALLGMLEDIPLAADYPELPGKPGGIEAEDPGMATLSKLGFTGSLHLGSWFLDPYGHGGRQALPSTASEREEWGRQGISQMRDIVHGLHIKEALEALKQHDEFTQKVIVPKLGKMLPTPADSH